MDSTRRSFLVGAAALTGASFGRIGSAGAQAAQSRTNPYEYRRNWGRWGADDQMGAVNLITPEKRIAAARLVTSFESTTAEPAVRSSTITVSCTTVWS